MKPNTASTNLPYSFDVHEREVEVNYEICEAEPATDDYAASEWHVVITAIYMGAYEISNLLASEHATAAAKEAFEDCRNAATEAALAGVATDRSDWL